MTTQQSSPTPEPGRPSPWLRRMLQAATQAPGPHDGQPWRVRVRGTVVDVLLDPSQRVPSLDPHGREGVIACGAFLQHMTIAARHFGRSLNVCRLPPEKPDVLARATIGGGEHYDLHVDRLYAAIGAHADCTAFADDDSVEPFDVGQLTSAALTEGTQLVVIDDGARRAELRRLIAGAGRIVDKDGAAATVCDDGFTSDVDADLDAPLIGVLVTDGDGTADWLKCGEALGRVWLTAAAEGIAVVQWNAAIELSSTRERLKELLAVGGVPQVVLGFGHPTNGLAAIPRRSVDDILVD